MTDPMDALRANAAADPPAGAADVETVVAATAETAMPSLWSYFGGDDDRVACRLIVGEEDVGYVGRGAVLGQMAGQVRGLGDASAGATPPGASTGYAEIELRCDEPACRLNPIHTFLYDAEFPLHCPLHPQRVLHPPQAD
jgi:hypothetical protein